MTTKDDYLRDYGNLGKRPNSNNNSDDSDYCNNCTDCSKCFYCDDCEKCKNCLSCDNCIKCQISENCSRLTNGFLCKGLRFNKKDINANNNKKYWLLNEEVNKAEWLQARRVFGILN